MAVASSEGFEVKAYQFRLSFPARRDALKQELFMFGHAKLKQTIT